MNALRLFPAFATLAFSLCAAAANQERAEFDDVQRAAVARFFELQIERAEALAARGSVDQALEIARAVEAIIPEWAGGPARVRDLRLRLLDLVQWSTLISGEVRVKAPVVEVGDAAGFEIVLTNVSGARIEIDMDGGVTMLSVRFEESDHAGCARTEERNVAFRGFEGRLLLEPGDSASAVFSVDTGSASPLSPTMRRYEVFGLVRPKSMRAAERQVTRPISLHPAAVLVAPRGSKPTRDAPLDALVEGIGEECGPKVFIAARFLPEELSGKGMEALEKALEKTFSDPSMARAVRAAIRLIARDPSAPLDPEGFERWMASRDKAR